MMNDSNATTGNATGERVAIGRRLVSFDANTKHGYDDDGESVVVRFVSVERFNGDWWDLWQPSKSYALINDVLCELTDIGLQFSVFYFWASPVGESDLSQISYKAF